jgi:hypothetical protein
MFSKKEMKLLNEIKSDLEEIKKTLAFHDKMFEDFYMQKEEADKKRKEMVNGPFSIMKLLLQQSLGTIQDEEKRKEMAKMLNLFENLGAEQ